MACIKTEVSFVTLRSLSSCECSTRSCSAEHVIQRLIRPERYVGGQDAGRIVPHHYMVEDDQVICGSIFQSGWRSFWQVVYYYAPDRSNLEEFEDLTAALEWMSEQQPAKEATTCSP